MIKPATFNKMCILGQRTPVGYREGSSMWYRGLSQAPFFLGPAPFCGKYKQFLLQATAIKSPNPQNGLISAHSER